MGYSMNIEGNFVKAQRSGINASYKDLSIVCNAIRYAKVGNAIHTIDELIAMRMPIRFTKYNKRMGARHELHGRKGAYPIKAAKEVRTVLQNAVATAESKGIMDPEEMFVVHAAANKTQVIRRQPSKGSISWGRGMYGRSAIMHSDIELAKVEIALAMGDENTLTKNMKYFIKKNSRPLKGKAAEKKTLAKKPALPKTVDATNPKEMQKFAKALNENISAKKEEKHEHTHDHEHAHGHDHAHEHEHQHEHKVEEKKDEKK